MALPNILRGRLRLPLVGSPLFVISTPDLVLAQCKAGIMGAFPALNARPVGVLDEWLPRIKEELAAWDQANPTRLSAPFAVNQIVHKSNNRLEADVALCVKHEVPVIITSLGAREELNQTVHGYGGLTLHDVINNRFAHKAIEKGADGLIPVAAGGGGHGGTLSPFALMREIREWFQGPVALAGGIAHGASILAALACGADLAYAGSVFIATREANAPEDYKKMIVGASADDIIYTNLFTGVHGNYLKPSVVKAGLDPENLPLGDPSKMNFASGGNMDAKAWRDIWGCGQGIGIIHEVPSVGDVVDRLEREFGEARRELEGKLNANA
jgi:nitronate monooxygenase